MVVRQNKRLQHAGLFSRGTRRLRGSVSVRHRICAFLTFAVCASAAVLRVGPGQQYLTPCRAIDAAAPGDRIQIDAAGNYDRDVCGWTTNDLTIVGVNGRPRIDAASQSFRGRAIWIISGDNTTVENIEFVNARGPNKNGAAILQLGTNLTVRKCYIHGNEDGILAGENPASHILIENTEFAENGYGDGQSHNIYIGHIARFTLRFSYSHDAISGHLVKSRALQNFILYNRLTGESGTSSYELDLPNGGLSYVIGNVIEQGPLTENSTIVEYGLEGTLLSKIGFGGRCFGQGKSSAARWQRPDSLSEGREIAGLAVVRCVSAQNSPAVRFWTGS